MAPTGAAPNRILGGSCEPAPVLRIAATPVPAPAMPCGLQPLLAAALAIAFDGMAAILADGRLAAANRAARTLLGLDESEGRPLWQTCATLGSGGRDRLHALLLSGRADGIVVDRMAAGPLELRWRPLGRDADGAVRGLLAVREVAVHTPAGSAAARPADHPETLRIMLDHLPGVLALKDAHTRRFVEVRGAEVVSPGATTGSMVGKTVHDIYPAALAAEIDAVESEVLRQPHGVHETQFRVEGTGRPQWFLSKKLAVADAAGAIRYLLTYNIEITAQVQAQRALDRTNAFLDAVIDYMPALVAVREIGSGRLVRVNRGFADMLARIADAPADASGRMLPPAIGSILHADDVRLRRSPQAVAERVFTLGSGEAQRHFHSRSVAIPDEQNQPAFILAMLQDITERVHAERALAESRTFLSRILKHLPSALSVKDARTRRYLFFNDPAQGALGRPGAAPRIAVGRTAENLFAHADAIHLSALDDSIVAQPTLVLEREVAHGEGRQRRWLHVKKLAIPDENGGCGYILTIVDDITTRRRTLEELRHSEACLKRSQAIGRIGSWRQPLRRWTLEWSDQMFEIWNEDPARFVPGLRAVLRAIHGHDRRQLLQAVRRALKGTPRFSITMPLRRSALGVRFVCLDAEVESDAQGHPIALFGTCQDITERIEAEERIRHLAQHDALTALPNRAVFDDRLGRAVGTARRTGALLAVHCLDLNDFKGVNDTMGHAAGDELLRQVAQRLAEAIRGCDTVARLGGDEFAIIQLGAGNPGAAVQLAERLLATLSLPYRIDGQEVYATASIGIALWRPGDGDPHELLRQADLALYAAKAEGRGCFAFFSPDMNERLHERKRIESRLRNAAKRGEISLVFQPQFCLRTQRLVGVESLMRWHHPDLGLVSPARFIPVAEECGLILELGELALRQSCRQARLWLDRGWSDARIAVNLSPAQFAYQDLTVLVRQILDETGLPARCLELEITEGMLMRDRRGAEAMLDALHSCGVTLALDDFGIGYSSLSYLKRFNLDKLKIDRSFVGQLPDDAGDAAIARTIIHLGKTLQLKVLAEGVETEDQRDFLLAAGCDEAQGYLFARPLPAAELEPLLP